MALPTSLHALLLLLLLLIQPPPTAIAAAAAASPVNPFTAKAAFIRYWNRKVPNNRPHPPFFVAKLSPLSAATATAFSNVAAAGGLKPKLPSLCAAAAILCPSPSTAIASAAAAAGAPPGSFGNYQNSNFTNYGTGESAGADAFANYSPDLNLPVDSFRRYSHDAAGRNDTFLNYQPDGNVVTANFTSYAGGATGGAGSFAGYADEVNVPELKFTNYDAAANGRDRAFSSYSQEANSGEQSFSGYGRDANGDSETFTSYGNNTNVVGSGFKNYGEAGNGATDSFTGYGTNGNVPENTFKNYGAGGNAGSDRFTGYREDANVGDDSFASYAKEANAGDAEFENYGKSFNQGSDSFKGYGEGGNPNHKIGFKGYFGDNTTFKAYADSGVQFKEYHNSSSSPSSVATTMSAMAARTVKTKWAPEPGKFFRESELVAGNQMPMPDIRDKMPPRAFLPRAIARSIPFTAAAVSELFGMAPDTAMGKAVAGTVAECARPPSRGETKRCASSAEDVVDFAVEVLGNDIVVRSTASTAGSGGSIEIGKVRGINGGNVTRSVSCHQSLFPYLVYYCHSVPKVRVYEADVLAVGSKDKINEGVAICHLDTSDWSANHGAFAALGGKPGEIEVCHWIFQGDMTWAVAD